MKTVFPALVASLAALSPTVSLAQSAPSAAPTEASTPQRFSCLSGYPDGTFRGNAPVTRYEFAAGLNACLEQINQLLPNRADYATKNDLDTLIQRQRSLNEQVRELNQRTDSLAK